MLSSKLQEKPPNTPKLAGKFDGEKTQVHPLVAMIHREQQRLSWVLWIHLGKSVQFTNKTCKFIIFKQKSTIQD
jgi:hypothetical protein